MSVTSANPERLAQYSSGGAADRAGVDQEIREVSGLEQQVLSSTQFAHPETTAYQFLTATLDDLAANERFVSAIHDALVAADSGAQATAVSIADADIEARLAAAGLLDAPALVTVEPDTFAGDPPNSGFAVDPVCVVNGNFVHRDQDLAMPGRCWPLSVVRTYNSVHCDRVGSFGRGWSSALDMRVDAVDQATPMVSLADGAAVAFTRADDGRFVPSARPGLRLSLSGPRWTLTEANGFRWQFDEMGLLVGAQVGLARLSVLRLEDGSVVVTEQASGRSVTYAVEDGVVRRATSSDGRTCAYEYDGEGAMTVARRADGDLTYAGVDGRITTIVDADGVVIVANEYDESGRVQRQTSPLGRVTTFSYNEGGVAIVEGGDGVRNVYVHDGRGNLTTLIDGEDGVMRLSYDDRDRVRAVVDRTLARTEYRHDDAGRLVERRDPDGRGAQWEWDAENRLTAATDRAGGVWRYEYDDGSASPRRLVGPDGAAATIAYDGIGQPTLFTDPDGVAFSVAWDSDGQPESFTDALGNRITFRHDERGRLLRVTDPASVEASFEVDEAGRVLRAMSPSGRWTYGYSPAGRPRSGRAEGGVEWSLTYSPAGVANEAWTEQGSRVGFGYDDSGNMTEVVAPDGERYLQHYDGAGRLIAAADPAGNRVACAYDAEGRLIETTDVAGRTWRRKFDSLGRMTSLRAPDGTSTTWEHHPNGAIRSVTDPAGATTLFDVDSYGRVTAATDPLGRTTTFGYTSAGRLAWRRSPAGRTDRYHYDAAGRLQSVTRPDGSVRSLELDGLGRVLRVEAGEESISFTLDAGGRVVRRVGPGPESTASTYDSLGRIHSVGRGEDWAAVFEWDPRSLLGRVLDPAGQETRFERNVRGQLAVARTGTAEDRFDFDRLGHLSAVTDALGRRTGIETSPTGDVTGIERPDGSGWLRELDWLGRTTAARSRHGSDARRFEYDSGGRLVRALSQVETSLAWDAAGQLSEVACGTNAIAIERDDDGLVIALTGEGGARTSFERDPGGAVTWIEDTVAGRFEPPDRRRHGERDSSGRVLSDDHGRSYRYDRAGRLVEATRPDGEKTRYSHHPVGHLLTESMPEGLRRFHYDDAGQLIRVSEPDGTRRSFEYDEAGRRVVDKIGDDWVVRYQWDDFGRLRSIEEERANGSTIRTTIVNDAFGRPVSVDGVEIGWEDALTGQVNRVGERRYLSLRGQMRELAADAPWVDGRVDDPWGSDGASGVRVGFRNCLAYGDLVFMGARVYQTSTRSFLTPDPLAPTPGRLAYASPYAYTAGDPVNYLDPSGTRPLSDDEFRAYATKAEQGLVGQTWHAITTDPLGTLAMVGVTAAAVGLCFVGAPEVGVPILLGEGFSTAVGVATGNFNPMSVALGGVIGGVAAVTGGGLLATIGVAATGGAAFNFVDQIQHRGLGGIDWTKVAISGAAGGVIGGLFHSVPRIPGMFGNNVADAGTGSAKAALDSNVIIPALDNGEFEAIDKALAGRLPIVSPTAAGEYLARGSQETLDQFLADRGGSIGLAGTQEGAAALQAQAAALGRALGMNDALIAHSAAQEGIPLITSDQQLLRFLNAIGYPAEGF